MESPLGKRSQRDDKSLTTALASSLRFSDFLQTWDTWAMPCVPAASVLCSCWPCGWLLHAGNLSPDHQHPKPGFGNTHLSRSDPHLPEVWRVEKKWELQKSRATETAISLSLFRNQPRTTSGVVWVQPYWDTGGGPSFLLHLRSTGGGLRVGWSGLPLLLSPCTLLCPGEV